jgi:hypothetical protein
MRSIAWFGSASFPQHYLSHRHLTIILGSSQRPLLSQDPIALKF